jgi:hypothetical protein
VVGAFCCCPLRFSGLGGVLRLGGGGDGVVKGVRSGRRGPSAK